uniref:Uncharacterized protein n=1 Tax=Strigamia maritima TaxID=126957 RepID=T1J3K2_STRMM
LALSRALLSKLKTICAVTLNLAHGLNDDIQDDIIRKGKKNRKKTRLQKRKQKKTSTERVEAMTFPPCAPEWIRPRNGCLHRTCPNLTCLVLSRFLPPLVFSQLPRQEQPTANDRQSHSSLLPSHRKIHSIFKPYIS